MFPANSLTTHLTRLPAFHKMSLPARKVKLWSDQWRNRPGLLHTRPMSRLRAFTFALVFALLAAAPAAAAPRVPTIDDLLAIRTAGGAQISPDGAWVAYTVTESDFELDAFVSQVWLVSTTAGQPMPLTRGPKSAGSVRWSPDGRWLAFTSTRAGDKSQVFAIRPDGGEAIQLTAAENGVNDYAWSPDGTQIAFTATEPESKALKDRKERFGDFAVVRSDYAHAHVWTVALAEALTKPSPGVQRTSGRDFHVGQFAWSPDGARVAFSATANPDLVQSETSDIYVLTLATGDVRKVVSLPGPDTNPRWSPDGATLAFQSAMGRRDFYHGNSVIAVVSAAGGTPRSVTDTFDEEPSLLTWMADGLYLAAYRRPPPTCSAWIP